MDHADLPTVISVGLVAVGSLGALLYGYFSLRKMRREMESGRPL